MRDNGRVIIGLVILFFGIGFLLQQFGFFTAYGISFSDIVNYFWPVVLLIIGSGLLLKNRLVSGLFFFGWGAMLLLSLLFSFNFWDAFWPMILIVLGFLILFRKSNNHLFNSSSGTTTTDEIHDTVAFWGADKKITSKQFKGGSVECYFGGMKLDLRETKFLKEGSVIDISCVFGGIEIFIPNDITVSSEGMAIFGGWENKFSNRTESKSQLKITGSVYFGGVTVKN